MTKRILLGVFILHILLPNVYAQNPEGYLKVCRNTISGTIPLISVEHLKFDIAHDTPPYILDTRTYEEFKVSHIPNAIWVGYENFDLDRVSAIDKTEKIIVYCSIGYRSEKIGEQLIKEGFSWVNNLEGGIFNWSNCGNILQDVNNHSTTSVHGFDQEWSQWLNESTRVIIPNE